MYHTLIISLWSPLQPPRRSTYSDFQSRCGGASGTSGKCQAGWERRQAVLVTHAPDLYINPLWAKNLGSLNYIWGPALPFELSSWRVFLAALELRGGDCFASANPLSCLFSPPPPVCLLFFPTYYSFYFFIRSRPVEHKLLCEWHLCQNQLECWRFTGLAVLCGLYE